MSSVGSSADLRPYQKDFFVGNNYSSQPVANLNFAKSLMGDKAGVRVALANWDMLSNNAQSAELANLAKKLGWSVVISESIPLTTTDFGGIEAAVNATHPNIVIAAQQTTFAEG